MSTHMGTIENLLQKERWPRSFLTLHAAMNAVGLEYALEGHKPVTLFAPDDLAFNQLHQGAIFDLYKDIDLLRDLLAYHIVPLSLTRDMLTQVFSSSAQGLDAASSFSHPQTDEEQSIELPTISGRVLLAKLSPTFQVQGVKVLEPGLEAENGMLYPVESILWPPEIREASFGERSPLTNR